MEMIDLARPRPEPEKIKISEPSPAAGYDPYSYNLQITLNKEELDKLGLDITQFKVGDDFDFAVQAKIRGVSQSEDQYGGQTEQRERLEIQITHIGLENTADFNGAFAEATANEVAYGKPNQTGGFKTRHG